MYHNNLTNKTNNIYMFDDVFMFNKVFFILFVMCAQFSVC